MAGYAKPGTGEHDLGAGWLRHNLDLERGHFSYLERAGRAPALILIPGSFGDSYCLKEIIDNLDAAIHLVVIEVRGHGGGWPPPLDCSIEEFARDALRVVDELALSRFFIGGHSIGGMIALEVGRVRPQAVSGVISIEGWTSHHVLEEAFAGQVDSTMSAAQASRNEMLRARVLDSWSAGDVAEFRTYWKNWDGYAFLCETDVPILEIYGDRSAAPPPRHKLRIPERAHIDLQWVANASHNLHLEAPGEVARLTEAFIQRHDPERGARSGTRRLA